MGEEAVVASHGLEPLAEVRCETPGCGRLLFKVRKDAQGNLCLEVRCKACGMMQTLTTADDLDTVPAKAQP